jgi:hypothetical protein
VDYRINEFAEMVHPRDGHPKMFAMVEAYLDESGIHDGAPVCLIAGYFGSKSQFIKFEGLWEKRLDSFEIPLEEFHAKDFVKRQGFFLGWEESRWQKCMETLAEAIVKYKIHPVSYGIIVGDFYSFSYNQRRFLTGATLTPEGKLITSGAPNKPYFAPFQQLTRRIASYAPVNGKVHFFFGLDRPFAEYARDLYATLKNNPVHPYRERLGDPTFPLAKETPELQAADFLVYLTYLHMQERMKTQNWYIRPHPVLRTLHSRLKSPEDLVFQDKECIRGTLNMIPIEQRGELLSEF